MKWFKCEGNGKTVLAYARVFAVTEVIREDVRLWAEQLTWVQCPICGCSLIARTEDAAADMFGRHLERDH